MKIRRTILALLCFCFLNVSCYAQAKQEPPKEWTFENIMDQQQIGSIEISPDGEKTLIGYADKRKNPTGFSRVVVISNKDKKVLFSTPEEINYTEAHWSPNGKWISLLRVLGENGKYLEITEGDAYAPVMVWDDTMHMHQWSPDGTKISYLAGAAEPFGAPCATKSYQEYKTDTENSRIYLIDIDIKNKRVSNSYPLTPVNIAVKFPYAWAPDSKTIALPYTPKGENDDHSEIKIGLIDIKTRGMKEITSDGYPKELAFSPDGKNLALTLGFENGTGSSIEDNSYYITPQRVCLFELSTNNKHCLANTPDQRPLIIGWDEKGENIIISEANHTEWALYTLPIDGSAALPFSIKPFSIVRDVSLSTSRTRMGFIGESSTLPPEAYISSLKEFSPTKITDFHAYLNELPPLKAEVIQWKSFDGQLIEGILTYPVAYESGKPVPLYVDVHGGPGGVFLNGYSGFMGYPLPYALIAQKGFAILAPNIRGSKGYGLDFRAANFRDWGDEPFKDLMAGVDFLIEQGIADPDKLAIGGWSYGGYMAAWAIGHTDRFNAAIVGAGPVNLIAERGNCPANRFMEAYYGVYWDDYKTYLHDSPLMYVQNMETPTLVIQGDKDRNVSPTAAHELYTALEKKEVPTKLLIYRGEDHGLKGESRRSAAQESFEWITKYALSPNKSEAQK